MFNPEFRYLLVQEENMGVIIPLIDPHIYAAIIVCSINAGFICIGLWILWNVLKYPISLIGTAFTYFWKSLTPGFQWLEILYMITCLVIAAITVLAFNQMIKKIDTGINGLKQQLMEKEKKIQEMEKELELLKTNSNGKE